MLSASFYIVGCRSVRAERAHGVAPWGLPETSGPNRRCGDAVNIFRIAMPLMQMTGATLRSQMNGRATNPRFRFSFPYLTRS